MHTHTPVRDKVSCRALHLAVALFDCFISNIFEHTQLRCSAPSEAAQRLHTSPDGVDGVDNFDEIPINSMGMDLQLENTECRNHFSVAGAGNPSSYQIDREIMKHIEAPSSHALKSKAPKASVQVPSSWIHRDNTFDSAFMGKLHRSGGHLSAVPKSGRRNGVRIPPDEEDAFDRLVSNSIVTLGEDADASKTAPAVSSVAASPGTPPPIIPAHPPPLNNATHPAPWRDGDQTSTASPGDLLAWNTFPRIEPLAMDESLVIDELLVIGMTCLHIAAKFEDVAFISIEHLLPLTWRGELTDRLRHEERILTALKFDLHHSTMMDFIPFYCDALSILLIGVEGFTDSVSNMASAADLFAALSLSSGEFAGDRYSVTAAAICVYCCIIAYTATNKSFFDQEFISILFATVSTWAVVEQNEDMLRYVERIIRFHFHVENKLQESTDTAMGLSSADTYGEIFATVQLSHAAASSWLNSIDARDIGRRVCEAFQSERLRNNST